MGFASPAGELNGGLVRPAPEVTMTQSHWLQSAIDLQRTVAVQFTTVSNAAGADGGAEFLTDGSRPILLKNALLFFAGTARREAIEVLMNLAATF